MSGKQQAVIWIGLVLIVLNLVAQWGDVRSVLFGSKAPAKGSGTPNPSFPGPNPWNWILPFILPLNSQKPPVQSTPPTVGV